MRDCPDGLDGPLEIAGEQSMEHGRASFVSLQLVSKLVLPLQHHNKKLHGPHHDFHIELQRRFQE